VKKNGKKSVGLLELETAVLECFLEKTPLSPLGVNMLRAFLHTLRKSKFLHTCIQPYCFLYRGLYVTPI
jgi:hypothetical protein